MALVVPKTVRKILESAGWREVGNDYEAKRVDQAAALERLEQLLNMIYVDNRRKVQVKALEEARHIARSL